MLHIPAPVYLLAPFIGFTIFFALVAYALTKRAEKTDWRILASKEAAVHEVRLAIADAYIQRLRMRIPEETFTENELIDIFLIYTGETGQEIVRALEEIFSPEFAPEMQEAHRISGAQSLLTWMKALYTGDFSRRPIPFDGSIPWTADAIDSVRSFVDKIRTNKRWPDQKTQI